MARTIESPESNETTKFHLFPHLPTELRSQIWKDAVLSMNPRVVLLEPKQLSTECNKDGPAGPTWGFRSCCPLPELLITCRESFGVASKYYQRSFGTKHAFPQTWFDFERDYLYLKAPGWRDRHAPERQLSDGAIVNSLSLEERRKIQRLVLGSDYGELLLLKGIAFQEHVFYEALKAFDRVKEMYSVYWEGWTAKDLVKGTQLVLRELPDVDRVYDLLANASYRREKFCVCFNQMVDQWGEVCGRRRMRPYSEVFKLCLEEIFEGTQPKIMEMMVLTAHLDRVIGEAMKQLGEVDQ